MTENEYQDQLDEEHALDLAVDIIQTRLDNGEEIVGDGVIYTADDSLCDPYRYCQDPINTLAQAIAPEILKHWSQTKESGE